MRISSEEALGAARQPSWVRCKSCQHRWIGFYLPLPIEEAGRVMKSLTCPSCGAPAKELLLLDARRTPSKP